MLRLSIVLALTLAASVCCADEVFEPLKVGAEVPVYTVQALDGKAIRIGRGEPLSLVNLWATWCGPCRREFPEIEKLHQQYRARGLRVVAVSIDRGSDNAVRTFAKFAGVTFLIALDKADGIERAYRASGVPESFIIGVDGRLLWHRAGVIDLKSRELRAALELGLRAGSGVSARPVPAAPIRRP